MNTQIDVCSKSLAQPKPEEPRTTFPVLRATLTERKFLHTASSLARRMLSISVEMSLFTRAAYPGLCTLSLSPLALVPVSLVPISWPYKFRHVAVQVDGIILCDECIFAASGFLYRKWPAFRVLCLSLSLCLPPLLTICGAIRLTERGDGREMGGWFLGGLPQILGRSSARSQRFPQNNLSSKQTLDTRHTTPARKSTNIIYT